MRLRPNYYSGSLELERTGRGWLPHRLPARARAQCDDPQLLGAESQPSGVPVAFRTAASAIELDVRGRGASPGRRPGAARRHRRFRRRRSGDSAGAHVRGRHGACRPGYRREQTGIGSDRDHPFDGLAPRAKDMEILVAALREGRAGRAAHRSAPVEPLSRPRKRWVHYGSSISQGSNAASPSTTWPAIAAALAGVELRNLGLSGSALLDPFVAGAIRDQSADVISVKLGINLVNADLMRQRAFGPAVHGFLDTIRDGHPRTPLIVIGPLYCPIHEITPGPGAFDAEALAQGKVRFIATGDPVEATRSDRLGRLNLRYIRDQLASIVARRRADDSFIHYVNGLTLYGQADETTHPLPDQLHPDTTHTSADRGTVRRVDSQPSVAARLTDIRDE